MKNDSIVAAIRQSAALVPNASHRRFPRRRYVVLATLAFSLLNSVFCLRGNAQSYSIDWYKIAGGGGTSTSGVFSVSGTIGQPDAGVAMSGGNFSVSGGFWSLIAVVQTAGAPLLTITHSGNSVIISWPSPSTGFTLQTNGNLATGTWVNYGGTVGDNGTIKTETNSPPTGTLFFRLQQQQ